MTNEERLQKLDLIQFVTCDKIANALKEIKNMSKDINDAIKTVYTAKKRGISVSKFTDGETRFDTDYICIKIPFENIHNDTRYVDYNGDVYTSRYSGKSYPDGHYHFCDTFKVGEMRNSLTTEESRQKELARLFYIKGKINELIANAYHDIDLEIEKKLKECNFVNIKIA